MSASASLYQSTNTGYTDLDMYHTVVPQHHYSVLQLTDSTGFNRPYHRWCRWPESNRHGSRHYPLKIACLPIPPHRPGYKQGIKRTATAYSGKSSATDFAGTPASVSGTSGTSLPGITVSVISTGPPCSADCCSSSASMTALVSSASCC
jgi:hypothetical protein